MGVIGNIFGVFSDSYNSIYNSFPHWMQSSFSVFVFAVFVSLVSIFIWYFYKSLSQKELISLNLNQYNLSEHPFFSKFFAVVLYLVEYALIMPLLIFVWFSALSFIILLISSEGTLQGVLLLTAIMVASVRILSYVNNEISQDLAKLFPFITLSIFLLNPDGFSFEGIISKSPDLSLLIGDLFSFLIVIFSIEIILRIGSIIRTFWYSEKEE